MSKSNKLLTLKATKALKKSNNTIAETRIIWLLDPKKRTLNVIEQKFNVSTGNWIKGRAISLRKLKKGEIDLSCWSKQDQQALSGLCSVKLGWYGKEQIYFSFNKTILALIGHPLVFHAGDRNLKLELLSGTPALNIDETRDGYFFSLTYFAPEPGLILLPETENKYRVLEFTEELATISKLLPQKGLMVPVDVKDRVLTLIKEVSHNTIRIKTNVDDDSIPSIDPDPSSYLQILRNNRGMQITLGVRPFNEDGPFYKVAYENTTAIALLKTLDGQFIKTKTARNFQAEQDNVTKLLQACPTLQKWYNTEHEWQFDDLELCLEVLAEIDAYPDVNIEWAQGQAIKIKQTLSENDLLLQIKSEQNWFEYDGEIVLDNSKVLKMEMLLKLLDQNNVGRFIKLQDDQFIALTKSFKEKLIALKVSSDKQKIPHLQADLLEAIAKETKELIASDAWQEHIANLHEMRLYKPTIPNSLNAELRDYQLEGFQYLSRLTHWGIGACLADDMGLGKTVQTIAVLLEQAAKGPALVIAPTSVCFNWIEELTKFAPNLQNYSLFNNFDRRACINNLSANDVLICSYGLLQQQGELLINKKWNVIVLDEAQSIKNANTQRAQNAIKLVGNCKIALTGTPIENHLSELWSIFRFLNPGILGSAKSFQNRFVIPIEKHKDPEIKAALKQLIQPFILRRLKSEVLDELPPKTEQYIFIEGSEEEVALYEAVRQQSIERIEKMNIKDNNQKRFSILAEITKLRQLCCDCNLVDSSFKIENSKTKLFLKIVQELLENNHRALIFSQYVRYLDKIKKVLQENEISYQYIDGQVSANKRKQAVTAFQAGEGDVFLLSLKAGGMGINLTAADYVLHLDPWWNPAVEDQASDRAHRIGQENPVTIYKFIMKNTIEEKIVKLHQGKRELANDLLADTDLTGRISNEELLDLIC